MNAGMKLLATAGAAIVCAVGAPAAAQAATTVTVTGDTGAATPLTAGGAPVGIRNMDVQAVIHVDTGGYAVSITDGAGNSAATTSSCTSGDTTKYVDYHGNGTYTLSVTSYSDSCTKPLRTATYTWTVTAGVQIAPPAPTMLTRQANSFSTITQQFNFAPNPGEPPRPLVISEQLFRGVLMKERKRAGTADGLSRALGSATPPNASGKRSRFTVSGASTNIKDVSTSQA